MPPKVKAEKGVVKAEKGVAVKKEKVTVKKELADGSSKTGVRKKIWDSKLHYRHQVAFLNEAVPPPWNVCFGALGTGIIGVQPEASTTSSASSSSAPAVKAEPDDSEVPSRIPLSATVVLLMNAPSCSLQGRNGNPMGGYGDTLDVESRTLHWKSQRSDKGTMIGRIVSHQQNGGRLLCGVRRNIGAAGAIVQDGAKFKLLGAVSRIDNIQESRCLLEDGTFIICDGVKMHKAITAACLDPGLKAGIGLSAKRYPLSEKLAAEYQLCKACCYAEANARLHFDELNEEGVNTYRLGQPENIVKKGRKAKVKNEPSDDGPRKRLRFKQERPNGVAVKLEREDSAGRPQSSATDEFIVGQRVQRRDENRDWAFGYVTSLDPLECTAKDVPSANGYQWDEVRHVPKGAAADKERAAKVKGLLGKMQVASARNGRGRGRPRGSSRGNTAASGSTSKPAPSGISQSQETAKTNLAAPEASVPAPVAPSDKACTLPLAATHEAPVAATVERDDDDDDEVEIIEKEGGPPLPVPTAPMVLESDTE